ncbi:MAG: DUF433 domain-containing protein [Acidobacteria bacterium]|nr:DUF433 domain-containing protein [Acidobacteriota bacterium]MBI3657524.1 DUF433 domain-containing protein [Acidobacteriota bacterium]
MEKQYVEQRDRGYWVAGTRVSLDSIVFAFLDGLSSETIVAECFPILTLEQVYGAITYYLAHRAEIDAYLKQAAAEFEAWRQAIPRADPNFSERLAEARRRMQMTRL